MGEILNMNQIVKKFNGVEVLHNVDLTISEGEVVALCGENGAGKSTLMKILMGIYKQDSGDVYFEGKQLSGQNPQKSLELGIAMIHQELNLVDQLSIAQNVFLGREIKKKNGLIDFKEMNRRVQKVMEGLQERTPVTTTVGNLKVAQKQLVEIARAISFDCKLIVMDEPTAVLTDHETEILFETIRSLRQKGVAVIYISHRLAEIKQICDRVVILRDGKLITSVETEKVSEYEIATYMVGRELKISTVEEFKGDKNDEMLRVEDVTDGLLKHVSFRVAKGEIIGFSGLIGAGRTELMEFIFGLRKTQTGRLYIKGKEVNISSPSKALRHNIGFATEDRKVSGIVGIRSIHDNMNYSYIIKCIKAVLSKKKLQDNDREMIEQLKIVCQGPRQLIKNLSGGNQQKVILARWLLAKSEILILDEPTRGIDVGAREEIYQIIRNIANNGGTVIIVSSDLPELLEVCPRILVMYEGKVMGELEGEKRTEDNLMALGSGLALG